ncbi:MAG TPA: TIGR03016 family PEP-CTERM system-associated outer membrane protein, partial [Rhodocyclaceae bacterium]|nr:TIGR03016 family PEP-CTERM system-associated outer membrane protein [Rhodocyclaceae bacterium]
MAMVSKKNSRMFADALAEVFATVSPRASSHALPWLVALCLGAWMLPAAAQWRTSADVRLTETYTDNVDLAPADSARSDWVSEVTPSIRISGRSTRLKADLAANVTNTAHATQKSDNLTSVGLNANGNLEAVENMIFVDGSAGITRQATSLFGQSTANSYNGQNNTTQVRRATLSPYGLWRFGGTGVGELRYRADYTDSDSDAVRNNLNQAVTGSLNNGSAWGRLGWGLSGNYTTGKSDQTTTQTSSNYRLLLSDAVAADLRVHVFGGREANNYTGQTLSYRNWGEGFDWTPSDRTLVSAEVSKRFFGNGYDAKIKHTFRHYSFDSGYSRDVTTVSQSQNGAVLLSSIFYSLAQAQNPSASPEQLKDLVTQYMAAQGYPPDSAVQVNALSTTYAVERRLYGAFAINGLRNTLSLVASRTERRSVNSGSNNLTGDFIFFTNTKETDANLTWNMRLSSFSSLAASIGHSDAEGDDVVSGSANAKRHTNDGTL